MSRRIINMMLVLLVAACSSCSKKAYLFTSFHEPANEGLRMLYSYDGYAWKNIDSILLKPLAGSAGIMRDPSLIQGPDGMFHLVWTTEWKGGNGFGYASSKDLLHWSEQQYIPVMQHEKTVTNVWAPELFYDDVNKQFIIIWASCIPGRFEKGLEDEKNNHRLYYTTTADFKTFSPTRLYLDPGFSAIDAVLAKRGLSDYVLVLKDNTRPERDIRISFGATPFGPFTKPSQPVTPHYTEGPAVARVKNGWLIYYDAYQAKKYGAVFTKGFISFSSTDNAISVPGKHKHGTILRVKQNVLNNLLKATAKSN